MIAAGRFGLREGNALGQAEKALLLLKHPPRRPFSLLFHVLIKWGDHSEIHYTMGAGRGLTGFLDLVFEAPRSWVDWR